MKATVSISAGLLVAGWWLVRATERTEVAPSPAPVASSAPAERARVRAYAPHVDVTPVVAPAVVDTPPPDLSIRGQRARLEDRFRAEATDGAWAPTAQQQLQSDVGRFATRDVDLRAVECRASMCRVELALATRDAASGFMEAWLRDRTWTGPGLADNDVLGSDGQPRLVMFVAKDGMEL